MGTVVLVDVHGMTVFYSITHVQDERVTYQVGSSDDVRSQYIKSGQLADSVDSQFRSINERTPVFAFSHHVGDVSSHNTTQEYSSKFS